MIMKSTISPFVFLALAACSSTKGGESIEDNFGEANCNISSVLCEIVPPNCPAGETATVSDDGFCYAGCVPLDACAPGTFDCNQGPAFCEIIAPTCEEGETLTTRNGCFGPCVDSSICKGEGQDGLGCAMEIALLCPTGKVDGCLTGETTVHACVPVSVANDCDVSKVLCEITPPNCQGGLVPTVEGDCYGDCVEITSCAPGTFECNQGPALCEIIEPTCDDGETLTTRNGCFGPCVESSICKGPSFNGIACALEIMILCPEGQIDGCTTGETTVHACVDE